jgi:hypothetical protein
MNLETYELIKVDNKHAFEFVSNGPKGKIIKRIEFKLMPHKNAYNLGFGDKNLETGELDDKKVTDNGDSKKVLATVVSGVMSFTNEYPDVFIYARGSTTSRTRLYRIGISSIRDEIVKRFELYGEVRDKWSIFERNTEYDAFAVKRKNIKFEI